MPNWLFIVCCCFLCCKPQRPEPRIINEVYVPVTPRLKKYGPADPQIVPIYIGDSIVPVQINTLQK